MRTLREQIAEMTQIILAEGAAHNKDLAALACVRAGFPPRLVAACLDTAMENARDLTKPVVINLPAFLRNRGHQ